MRDELLGQPTVLYVSGFARSGSTLLGNLLGQVEGLSHVGELGRLWLELTRTDRRTHCGCGLELYECPFWSGIVAELEDSPEFPDFEVMRRWYELTTLNARGPDWDAIDREAFVEALGGLYAMVWRAAGRGVIVDTSKQAAYGAVLDEVTSLRLRTVHLIRDPRGVMASRLRKSRDQSLAMQLRVLALDPYEWRQVNRASQRLAEATSGLTMTYENLTAAPAHELARVMQLLGEDADLGFVDDEGQMWLEPTHTVWGNKTRWDTGSLKIRQDLRWKDELSRLERSVVRLATSPIMREFGYL